MALFAYGDGILTSGSRNRLTLIVPFLQEEVKTENGPFIHGKRLGDQF